jgi:hypothetical protein
MPATPKGITDAGAVFAGNEYPHSPYRLASRAWWTRSAHPRL